MLPGYVGARIYGVSAGVPYWRKKSMGFLVQGDRLNQAVSLEFRIMSDGDTTDPDVHPCFPVGLVEYGSYFSLSLVVWQVSGLSPEKPISPKCN